MAKYIERIISDKVLEVQKYYPVTTITGPRQSGKTSLCRHLFPEYRYVNLEDLTERGRAMTDPTAFIDSLGKGAIIDEVQNVPELLSMIQVRVDEDHDKRYTHRQQQFQSASPDDTIPCRTRGALHASAVFFPRNV